MRDYRESTIKKAINNMVFTTGNEEFDPSIIDESVWENMCGNECLTEAFIRKYKDYVNWLVISYYQTLSEEFIREFKDKVNWWGISKHQTLSEDFIREFQDKVDWKNISSEQTLSEDII